MTTAPPIHPNLVPNVTAPPMPGRRWGSLPLEWKPGEYTRTYRPKLNPSAIDGCPECGWPLSGGAFLCSVCDLEADRDLARTAKRLAEADELLRITTEQRQLRGRVLEWAHQARGLGGRKNRRHRKVLLEQIKTINKRIRELQRRRKELLG